MTLPLNKTLDPVDFARLPKELAIVDQFFTAEHEQHPMRRWEYAMAVDAISRWYWRTDWASEGRRPVLTDVGGAGSPFWRMPEPRHLESTRIDPEINVDLATYLHAAPRLADVVTCLSVLEHVPDLEQFCYHLGCLVAPGGLLFLTMDYCDGFADVRDGFRVPDTYHFHWMRERIFNVFAVSRLVAGFLSRDFTLFGETDYTWRGPQVYDYTFASLALIKRA